MVEEKSSDMVRYCFETEFSIRETISRFVSEDLNGPLVSENAGIQQTLREVGLHHWKL